MSDKLADYRHADAPLPEHNRLWPLYGAGIENLGNSLVESDVLAMTDAEAVAFVREGIDLANERNTSGLVMPASGGRPDLSDDKLLSILNYLRKLADLPTDAP